METTTTSVAADELVLDERQLLIEELSLKLENSRIRHATRSAYRHLRKAWLIRQLDPEMALFRLITAEEEAATALILALRQQKYPGAHLLDHHRHQHKSAITPFLVAVQNLLANQPLPPITLQVHKAPPAIHIQLDMASWVSSPTPLFGTPDHPLNFSLRAHAEGETPKIYAFDAQLQDIAWGRKLQNLKALVKHEANLRNRILYATEEGVPSITLEGGAISTRLATVHRLNMLTIIILQTDQHQLFAVQCLEALLKAIGALGDLQYDYDEAGAAARSRSDTSK
jgi:hypothetical protein